MWTESRTPSPSRSAEIASSKSRALAGSIVKVASDVRSRRAEESGRAAAPAASPLDVRRKAALVAAVEQQRVDHVARDVRPAQRADDLRRARCARSARAPGRPVSTSRRRRTSTVMRRPRSKNGSTTVKRPRRSTTPTRPFAPRARRSSAEHHLPTRPASVASARSSASSRFVAGLSFARTSGRDALVVDVLAARACSSCRRSDRARRRSKARTPGRRRPCRRSGGRRPARRCARAGPRS